MRIASLHTAESNIEVFEAALRSLGRSDVTLGHAVRADLLAAAERQGGMNAEITAQTRAALLALSGRSDAVLLTCSTLGEAVACELGEAGVPVLRVDRALAKAAVQAGGKVVVLCAASTTLRPTARLFAEVAGGADVEVRLVPGAWDLFKAGDRDGYFAAIAAAAEAAYTGGAALVALAQASMAGAADRVTAGPTPLSSPIAGLQAAIAAVGDSAAAT